MITINSPDISALHLIFHLMSMILRTRKKKCVELERSWNLKDLQLRTFQSCSRYQLNQLGSKAASESTFKKSNTCGVSNNKLYFKSLSFGHSK